MRSSHGLGKSEGAVRSAARAGWCAVLAGIVLSGCAARPIKPQAAAVVIQAVADCDFINSAPPADMGEASLEIISLRARAVQCDIAVEGVAKILGVTK